MYKGWERAVKLELKTRQIISEQARYGWLFDSNKAYNLIKYIRNEMHTIEKEVIPTLPGHYKQYGVTVEKPFLISGGYKKMVTDWIDGCDGPFTRVQYFDIDLGSDKQVKEYLLGQGWKPTWWNISKKYGHVTSPKITKEGELCPNLDLLQAKTVKKIVRYLKLKHRRGLVKGLLKVVRPDGRIPAEANTLGAASTRMTHKKVVNIPGNDAFLGERIRALFISKPNYKIVGCDSKSNQLRMLAHYMGDKEYTHAVLGPDIHSYNQKKAKLATRPQAKRFIYGFIFGAGDKKVGLLVGGGAKEGRKIKSTFLNELPKLKHLIKSVQSRYDKYGYVYGLDGRKVWIDSKHKALNYLLQSAEAIYMKVSLCLLYKYITTEKLDAHFVAMIHDEYQLEVHDKDVERVVLLCEKAMINAGTFLNLTVPMAGDTHVGNNWSETH